MPRPDYLHLVALHELKVVLRYDPDTEMWIGWTNVHTKQGYECGNPPWYYDAAHKARPKGFSVLGYNLKSQDRDPMALAGKIFEEYRALVEGPLGPYVVLNAAGQAMVKHPGYAAPVARTRTRAPAPAPTSPPPRVRERVRK